MNIRDAKQEIVDAVRTYLEKDETGSYEIPVEKQRPLLLMGPPGIGKTAIVEQAARECGVNLVSYTITHHTRQSAIGLPFIEKKQYGGREYSVTEYTMSEIVASIYDQIERSGIKEGILFLDEINCVSETLAPTMLQFLQYKTFGTHRVPEGFVIVTAGNPARYNRSVRDLDIVTLDRVRRIDIEADYEAWKSYARDAGVHGAVLAYLEIKPQNFYKVQADVNGKRFVTARGWEDLSRSMRVCEKLGKPVTAGLVSQYLQDRETAEDFAAYYELYNKYKNVYRIREILDGSVPENTDDLKKAPFDEKLSLIGLLTDSLDREFRKAAEDKRIQQELFGYLKQLREDLKKGSAGVQNAGTAAPAGTQNADAPVPAGARTASELLSKAATSCNAHLQAAEEAGLLSDTQIREQKKVHMLLSEIQKKVKEEGNGAPETDYGIVRDWFKTREENRRQQAVLTGEHLTNSFSFLHDVYGDSQEMVIFLTQLTAGSASLAFIRDWGNDAYYRYNKLLLLKDRKEELKAEILQLM